MGLRLGVDDPLHHHRNLVWQSLFDGSGGKQIPLIMVGILFAPEYSSNMFYAVTKGSLAFVTFWAYGIISAVIILGSWWKGRKAQAQA